MHLLWADLTKDGAVIRFPLRIILIFFGVTVEDGEGILGF